MECLWGVRAFPFPPTGSTAGFALVLPTPPQGGLACNPEHPQARTGSPPEPASACSNLSVLFILCILCIDVHKEISIPGAVAGRSEWGRWPRLCQAWCGRDARAPGKPSSHDLVTPRAQNGRSIWVPIVVEGGPSVFVSLRVPFLLVFLRVPSWSFVPLRGYLFVLRAPSWIESRRFLPLVRNAA